MLCKCFWESAVLGQHPKKLYISICFSVFLHSEHVKQSIQEIKEKNIEEL